MADEMVEAMIGNDKEGITICETLIKMEQEDYNDRMVIDETGDFLTVLVPECRENMDLKSVKCCKCSAVLDSRFTQRNMCISCWKPVNASLTAAPTPVPSKKTLLNAISNCKNMLPFRCHYCSKTYDCKESFYNHIRVHAAKKKNPYLCGMCGKNFKELIQFKKHICARNVLKCNRCSKQFESIFRLENHYLIHSKYKCGECGKCLSSKTVLEEHKRVHTNEYPFKCEVCNRQFRQKSKYNGHLFICKTSANKAQNVIRSQNAVRSQKEAIVIE